MVEEQVISSGVLTRDEFEIRLTKLAQMQNVLEQGYVNTRNFPLSR